MKIWVVRPQTDLPQSLMKLGVDIKNALTNITLILLPSLKETQSIRPLVVSAKGLYSLKIMLEVLGHLVQRLQTNSDSFQTLGHNILARNVMT
jgi:hypothetical protein